MDPNESTVSELQELAPEEDHSILSAPVEPGTLASEEVQLVSAWLLDFTTKKQRDFPSFGFQEEAVLAIYKTLWDGTSTDPKKAVVVMPCGTGKTNVALWSVLSLARKQNYSLSVIVFVPSSALVDQFQKKWKADLQSLSDKLKSSGKLDFKYDVTTDLMDIKKGVVHIIISTYQSSYNVCQALEAKSQVIDLIVFDEAHRVANSTLKNSLALSDDADAEARNFRFGASLTVKCSRKLFITATPVNQVHLFRNREHDFGEVIYELPANRAISTHCLCNWDVQPILVVLSSESVNSDYIIEAKCDSLVKKLAGQTPSGSLHKVICFFNTCIDAAKAYNYLKERYTTFPENPKLKGQVDIGIYIATKLNDEGFENLHDENKRAEALAFLENGNHAIVMCVRALTEGVDAPGVNTVCFMSPRVALPSVIQAVGRALRNPAGDEAKTATVFVPFTDAKQDMEDTMRTILEFHAHCYHGSELRSRIKRLYIHVASWRKMTDNERKILETKFDLSLSELMKTVWESLKRSSLNDGSSACVRYFLNPSMVCPIDDCPTKHLEAWNSNFGFVCFKLHPLVEDGDSRCTASHAIDLLRYDDSGKTWLYCFSDYATDELKYTLEWDPSEDPWGKWSGSTRMPTFYRALCQFECEAAALFHVGQQEDVSQTTYFRTRRIGGEMTIKARLRYVVGPGQVLVARNRFNGAPVLGPPIVGLTAAGHGAPKSSRKRIEFIGVGTKPPGKPPPSARNRIDQAEKDASYQHFYIVRHSNFTQECANEVNDHLVIMRDEKGVRKEPPQLAVAGGKGEWVVVTFGRTAFPEKRLTKEFNPKWTDEKYAYEFNEAKDAVVLYPPKAPATGWNAVTLETQVKQKLREASRRCNAGSTAADKLFTNGAFPFDHPFPYDGWKTESCLIKKDVLDKFFSMSQTEKDGDGDEMKLYNFIAGLFLLDPNATDGAAAFDLEEEGETQGE